MLRNLLSIVAISILVTSCGTFKNIHHSSGSVSHSRAENQPVFLDHIEIDQESSVNNQRLVAYKLEKEKNDKYFSTAGDIESGTMLQFKYAILMDVAVESLLHDVALPFIEEWYGTPYRLGGNTKSGIDCSAFTLLFASSIYGFTLPRTSKEQQSATRPVSRDMLQEGDLVFFAPRKGKPVSHVGIYMYNNKFVHASTSGGVVISDLDEAYWKPRYAGAGRMNVQTASK